MNAEAALHEYLSGLNYSIDARPLINSSAPLIVWMVMRVFKVTEFTSDERLSVMATLTTSWIDNFLTWNPADYGGLTVIYRRADMMWRCTPFTLWNSGSSTVYLALNASHPIVLQYDGRTAMDISTVYTVVCEMDVTYFPWDVQQCQIQIKPSVMDVNHLIINPVPGMNLIASTNPSNTEWVLQTSSVVQYVNTVKALSGLYFSTNQTVGYRNMTVYYLNMTLARIPVFYVYNVIAPVCIITGLSLLSYFIPGNSGDRIGLTVSAFLSFSVFQSYVNNFIPRSATVPMLTSYIVSQMALSAVCILSGVVTLLLHNTKSAMPHWLRSIVMIIAKYLLVRAAQVHELQPQPQPQPHQHAADHSHDASGDYVTNFDASDAHTNIDSSNKSENSETNESNGNGGTTGRTIMIGTTAVGMVMSDSSNKSRFRSDWIVLNDVLNRFVLVICFTVIVSLTTYVLVTIELDGPSQ